MGVHSSNNDPTQKINPYIWQLFKKESEMEIVKKFHRDSQDDIYGELRIISLDSKTDLAQGLGLYQTRKQYSEENSIVKCYQIEELQNKSLSICTNERTFKVLTERIPFRWNELLHLTFQQIVYALKQMLKGFGFLYDNIGAFEITPRMIGIDQYGQIKVWANENFAKNHASQEDILRSSAVKDDAEIISQKSKMIRNIFCIAQQKCSNQAFPHNFEQLRIESTGKQTDFITASQKIERYISMRKINLPGRICHFASINEGRGDKKIKNNKQKLKTEFYAQFLQREDVEKAVEKKKSSKLLKLGKFNKKKVMDNEQLREDPIRKTYDQLLRNPHIATTESIYHTKNKSLVFENQNNANGQCAKQENDLSARGVTSMEAIHNRSTSSGQYRQHVNVRTHKNF